LRTWATFEEDAIALAQAIRLARECPSEAADLVHALGIGTSLDTGAPDTRLAHWASQVGPAQFRRQLTVLALRQWTRGGLGVYGISASTWTDAVITSACAAEALAEKTAVSPSQAFLTAVLGWIGMVPIARLFQRVHPQQRYPGPLRRIPERQRWERSFIQADTLSVGADLMRAWAYPEEFVSAVRGIPHPVLVQKGRPLAMLAHLGFHLEPVIREGETMQALAPTTLRCFESLGLSPSIIALITVEADERLTELREHPDADVA
jgi:hypothetical protein